MPNHSVEDYKIEKVAGLLKKSKSVLFITGAGISAASGLPTYRGVGGLYNGANTEDGLPIEEVLSGETLRSRPELTWKYLAEIENKSRQARFNQAHKIIAEMEKVFERVWVLTQNIDGFHSAAGSRNLIEIHGNIHELSCTACGARRTIKDFSEIEIPPRCPSCRGYLRPDVVFFGEMIPSEKLGVLYDQLERGFDIYFAVGTTAVFPYIRQPLEEAKLKGRTTVEINPGSSEISNLVDFKISLGAVEALEKIWTGVGKEV